LIRNLANHAVTILRQRGPRALCAASARFIADKIEPPQVSQLLQPLTDELIFYDVNSSEFKKHYQILVVNQE